MMNATSEGGGEVGPAGTGGAGEIPAGMNHLANEKSPYLLQHADNPVDWYPWGEEAFAKARREDKPIFLSIGYSTCHWCHVMEEESFEDPEVAALLNETFVCIKVDREERPDIDHVYMTVCQMLTGGGGWPLTIIMTPDRKPFFAATYIPKSDRFGRRGLVSLLPKVAEVWKNKRSEILSSVDRIGQALSDVSAPGPGGGLAPGMLDLAHEQLAARFDTQNGGFGNAPKFPTPQNVLFLLRHWKRTGDAKSLEMAELTLEKMRDGGIYDHIGFGFHRYSTDAFWGVPHFEKMLYDQAMISLAYVAAYQATGRADFKKTAEEIFAYVLRDMTSADGAFLSAEDADSDGEEGKFYYWTAREVEKILDEEDASLVIRHFGLADEGNAPGGASDAGRGARVLAVRAGIEALAEATGLAPDEVRERLEASRKKLFAAREKRMHPFKDDKVLSDWNGLMIAALARGARVFGNEMYLSAARRAADFVLAKMRGADGRLLHRYRGGDAAIQGNLDDYAFMIRGLIELYQAGFEVRYLREAVRLNDELVSHFWDEEDGGFFFTPDDGEELIVRRKEVYDGAYPSGNSVEMMNLLRLGRMTGDTSLEERAVDLGKAFSSLVERSPGSFSFLMCALDYAASKSVEIVVVGEKDDRAARTMLASVNRLYLPNAVVLFKNEKDAGLLGAIARFTEPLHALGGKATAYVCSNRSCDLPTTSVQKMNEMLQ